MSTLLDVVANAGNKLDRTLGKARNKVVHYTTGGGLENDVAAVAGVVTAVKTKMQEPEVKGLMAAGAVLAGTIGGFIGSVATVQKICDHYGYSEENQMEEGDPGYSAAVSIIMVSTVAVLALPMTMGTAYAVTYEKAITQSNA